MITSPGSVDTIYPTITHSTSRPKHILFFTMNKQLDHIFNDSTLHNDNDNVPVRFRPHRPYQFFDIARSIPFTTSPPVPFHVTIFTTPLRNPGAFGVVEYPRAPDGRECKMECGQLVVMQPNFTVTWYLEAIRSANSYVAMYIATNDRARVIRHLYVRKSWTREEEPESRHVEE